MKNENELIDNPLLPIYLLGEFNDFVFKSFRESNRIVGDEEWFTLREPPETPEGMVAVFNKTEKTWSVLEDHRGLLATNSETGEVILVDYIGEIKEGFFI